MKVLTRISTTHGRRLMATIAKSGALLGITGTIAVGCQGPTREYTAGVEAATKPGKEVIATDKAALPVGPYSQGIRAGNILFVAGEKGIDPNTNEMVPGGVSEETRQTLENIKAILEAGGASLDDVVSSLVHLTDINEFGEMNKVYAEYFKEAPPVRTTVGVQALPAGARVEITVIAVN